MKFIVALLLVVNSLFSCTSKLINPLEGSHSPTYKSAHKDSLSTYSGTDIYLIPSNNHRVRSIEKSRVIRVIASPDSSWTILTEGHHHIGYGNLKKCYVKKDDWLKKNQLIGEISTDSSFLNIYIEKRGKPLFPEW